MDGIIIAIKFIILINSLKIGGVGDSINIIIIWNVWVVLVGPLKLVVDLSSKGCFQLLFEIVITPWKGVLVITLLVDILFLTLGLSESPVHLSPI